MEPREPRQKIKDNRIKFPRSQSAIKIFFGVEDTLSATNVYPIHFWLEIAKRKNLNVHVRFFSLLSLDIFTPVYLMFDLSRGYANLGHS